MDNQKIDNTLNLALKLDNQELMESGELSVGYDMAAKRWDLIIKYSGDISILEEYDAKITYLLNGYAIINIPQDNIESIAQLKQIEYIEKPKRLFFSMRQGKRASCVNEVQNGEFNLTGKGVLVGIIDSGIDYSHPDFINDDGTTRIFKMWDQTALPGGNLLPPKGYNIGVEYNREIINEALLAKTMTKRYQIVPKRDISGHGTAVAGIAAGNGRASGGINSGMAPKSELIIVKLGNPIPDSFPKTSELMQALDYIIKSASQLNIPVAINISFGNTYGSHSGTSLLETYINSAAAVGRTVICIGSGNEADAAGHVSVKAENNKTKITQLSIGDREISLSLQIWKLYNDELNIIIRSPDYDNYIVLNPQITANEVTLGNTKLIIYYGEPSPYSIYQEIYVEFMAADTYIDSGIWSIEIIGKNVVAGDVEMWLPAKSLLNEGTAFIFPTESITLTIPSTASAAIAVGAYNSRSLTYAAFSGRGYTWQTVNIKPDIVAPGVDIIAPSQAASYRIFTGTSFAAPFVTGAASLLMEWGIVRANDLFLYGEKLKAYLIKGARQLPGFDTPNPMTGWGALCLRDSLPV